MLILRGIGQEEAQGEERISPSSVQKARVDERSHAHHRTDRRDLARRAPRDGAERTFSEEQFATHRRRALVVGGATSSTECGR